MREMRWTDEQAEAITGSGHVLLAASAGTGKTTTIVAKALWLLGLDVGVRASDGAPLPPCTEPCELEEIAAITFTEKAAYDLKRKLRKEIARSERSDELRWEVDRAAVGTIHAFCGELLRDHALRLEIDPTFRVLDERETRLRQDELIRDVLYQRLERDDPHAVDIVGRFGLYGSTYQPGAVGHVREVLRDLRWRSHRYEAWTGEQGLDPDRLVAIARRQGVWPEKPERAERDRAALERAAALHAVALEVTREWLDWLEEENLRDFDSLILDARRLLTRQETRAALESIRRRFRILIVDEFQDTDGAQRDIAFAIAGLPTVGGAEGPIEAWTEGPTEPKPEGPARAEATGSPSTPTLFLVGDPKQSIYRFRGADITVWNAVAETLGERGRRLELTHNFRSEPAVVRFVNRVCRGAMEERGEALASVGVGESRVAYRDLTPHRPVTRAGAVEWLAVPEAGNADERRVAAGRLAAARIGELVGRGIPVTDPETGNGDAFLRPCRYRHLAVLARTRKSLGSVETALREHGIPYYNTATAGLAERQEVMDLVSLLRILDNPWDDLSAFAFLRSPFVGLRDEILARIRLDSVTGRTSLLRQARKWLGAVERGESEPFPAPESPRIAEIELEALGRGLEAVDRARRLVDRADPAELLESTLEATGYRLHLLLRRGAQEALANIERFLALAEDYRHLPLGGFLELWASWGEQDLGIPQAPLYSDEDDVVSLSTVHAAKGLEWPIVFLVGTEEGGPPGRRLTNSFWCDPGYGPVFMPPQADRGDRAERLFERAELEEHAEEARLLYVALTRARDRLLVVGPTERLQGYGEWLGTALPGAVDARELGGAEEGESGAASRTDGPMEAFGFDEDAETSEGQLGLFSAGSAQEAAMGDALAQTGDGPVEGGGAVRPPPLLILRRGDPGSLQPPFPEAPMTLGWLEGMVEAEPPRLVRPLEAPPLSFLSSATELRMKERSPEEWELRYVHGIQPVWRFAPEREGEPALDPAVRGQVIHGVLERIEEAAEIARVLEETVSGIDAAEVEELLQPGTEYREALEREIERVVESPEWAWYVAPPHDPERHRELSFLHLIGPREWRQGAYDLYRPAADAALTGGAAPADSRTAVDASSGSAAAASAKSITSLQEEGARSPLQPSLFDTPAEAAVSGRSHTWIVDFKTHPIEGADVERTARDYDVQVRVYREAAEAVLGPEASVHVALHFTRPNVAVER